MRVMRDHVGRILSGRYRLVARIAGGGMGEVYRGHDVLLDRAVAVKIMQPSLASDPELVDRFRLEARAAARLLHPNAVAVHDWGAEDESTYYMVMEYVRGPDLRDILLVRGELEPAQAADVVAAVCDALAAAHAAGLVHRDVKPENILLSATGRVKVADFGIAVVTDADRTVPGGLGGTLRYVAPEQVSGIPATFASDIWAAGAVLAECLTGRPPPQNASPDLLSRRAEEQPLRPSELNPGIPHVLDEIVLRACALEPADRYADASEMADELRYARASVLDDAPPLVDLVGDEPDEDQILGMEPTTTGDVRARLRRRGRILRVVLIGCLLTALGFGGYRGVAAFLAPRKIDVPSVVKLRKGEARRKLEELGLGVDIEGRKDKHERRGEVLDQTPLTGVLEEGETVVLIVSTGPPKVAVPSLTGMTLSEATEVLEATNRNMRVGAISKRYSQKPAGTVIAYSPFDDRMEWGSDVTLVLSKGPEPILLPDVVGRPEENAVDELRASGFRPEVVTVYSDDVEAGRVISTAPAAATMSPAGSTVEVVVSAGPEFEELRMPDVRNLSVSKARAELESLGLRVRVVQSCGGDGTIVSETEPISGSTVRENDRVLLFVC